MQKRPPRGAKHGDYHLDRRRIAGLRASTAAPQMGKRHHLPAIIHAHSHSMQKSSLLYIREIITGYRYTKLYTLIYARMTLSPTENGRKGGRREAGNGMARPRTKGKRLALGIDIGLAGWLEWQGRAHDHGQAEYINNLMQADRAERMRDPEQARRYRLYLEACGYNEELAMLDAGKDA